MVEKLKHELASIEEGIEYMEKTDTAWSPAYPILRKRRRILKRAIKGLERVERQSAEYSRKLLNIIRGVEQ